MGGIAAHLRESGRSFAAVFRSANLRRLQGAWTAVAIGHWGLLVAVSVYAYDQGGEKAVGLIFLLRLVPAGLLAPFVGVLGDRYRREIVLFVSALLRFGFCAAAAVCVWKDAPAELVYALAIVTSIANAPYKSAQAAIMPTLAATPSELTATNAVSSTVESLAFFLGPAVAGLLLAVTGVDVVFAVAAAMFGIASLVILRMNVPRTEASKEVEASTILSECMAGFRVVFKHKELRVLMGLFTAQTLVAGLMLVFLVVVAIELLDMGDAGVGYLNSAFGVGALVGAIGALGLTGARRLSPGFLVGLLLWGLPLVVLGLWSSVAIALVLFAIMGAGNSLVDVAGYTLVQRAVPDEVLARVFGVLQFFLLSALGIGGVLAPVLSDALRARERADHLGAVPARARPAASAGPWRRSTRRRPPRRRRSSGCSPACRSSRRCRAPRSSTSPAGSCRCASSRGQSSSAKATPAIASTCSSRARST